jgi:hypothetical protein
LQHKIALIPSRVDLSPFLDFVTQELDVINKDERGHLEALASGRESKLTRAADTEIERAMMLWLCKSMSLEMSLARQLQMIVLLVHAARQITMPERLLTSPEDLGPVARRVAAVAQKVPREDEAVRFVSERLQLGSVFFGEGKEQEHERSDDEGEDGDGLATFVHTLIEKSAGFLRTQIVLMALKTRAHILHGSN